ncbi:hypothetical protein K505DRAFT_385321 [Melanomma pulvis-pyrius CBS 109.77]|uniref:Uncharacterized protein n=1 Tax=Melanomma pulvis-pyrius CBS 109.77 TaxID=1314802 RepID=A0A6A6XD20_9PLEO|nr:hypothetical protein K505DRAFT_385321 [Melanomma pulvis-pyrius CBS 109.77]
MMPGVSHRSTRSVCGEDLHYQSPDGKIEWVILRGTHIGMTSIINHWNAELFPTLTSSSLGDGIIRMDNRTVNLRRS